MRTPMRLVFSYYPICIAATTPCTSKYNCSYNVTMMVLVLNWQTHWAKDERSDDYVAKEATAGKSTKFKYLCILRY